jgi:hypothetical protein
MIRIGRKEAGSRNICKSGRWSFLAEAEASLYDRGSWTIVHCGLSSFNTIIACVIDALQQDSRTTTL